MLRLKRQVLNPHSTAGGILTSRVGDNGISNITVGLDLSVEVRPDEYATFKWVQTTDDHLSPLDSGYLLARWDRRTYQGFGYELGAARSGAGYDPAVGFALRSDYH
ncbi:MAG: hypothetical protein EXS58_11000 [Candidatus Latescibacteria bacterium]|nr:hypothetical protein [Candidatus Latescibacterota bacterium]